MRFPQPSRLSQVVAVMVTSLAAVSPAPAQSRVHGYEDQVVDSHPAVEAMNSISVQLQQARQVLDDIEDGFASVQELIDALPGADDDDASAVHRAGLGTNGARVGRARVHPIGGSGVHATIVFVDDGMNLVVSGTAHGLDPDETYVTLIYDNGSVPGGPNACLPTITDPADPDFILGTMLIGAWEVEADGVGTLTAVNTNGGADYVPLDKFRATSIRRVVSPPPAPGAPPETELEGCGRVATLGLRP